MGDNASARAELEAFIAGVESLRTMNEQVAKEAEEDVADVARKSAQAAVDPDGNPWPDREEGGKALRGAAAALESRAWGNRIMLSIGPPYVFHNWGAGGSSQTKAAERARARASAKRAKSGTQSKFHAPRRQILPEAGEKIPEKMREAIDAAAKRVFGKAVG